MGFAVIADEVRNLAQRYTQEAKDTAEFIEESITKSNHGKTKLGQVATAVRSIIEITSDYRDHKQGKKLVDDVNLASKEQARGIEQIAKGITQMEQVTQSTAAKAQENATASSELSTHAEAISLVVVRLRALITGDDDAALRT